MNDLIKINNKYVKVELKGKTEDIFKIAKAIAKACEEIKIEVEKEKIEVNNEFTKKMS